MWSLIMRRLLGRSQLFTWLHSSSPLQLLASSREPHETWEAFLKYKLLEWVEVHVYSASSKHFAVLCTIAWKSRWKTKSQVIILKNKGNKQTWKTLRSPSPYVCPWWPPPGPPWCRAPLLLSLPSSRCPPETLQCIRLHLMFPSFGGDEETSYVWLFVCLFLILSKSPICTEECFAISWTIVIFWPLKVKLKYTGVQSQ